MAAVERVEKIKKKLLTADDDLEKDVFAFLVNLAPQKINAGRSVF